jgi:hypothetical protein
MSREEGSRLPLAEAYLEKCHASLRARGCRVEATSRPDGRLLSKNFVATTFTRPDAENNRNSRCTQILILQGQVTPELYHPAQKKKISPQYMVLTQIVGSA